MPASNERNYAARNIVRSVLSESWVIHPPKLEEIVGVLEARAAGVAFTEEEIRERIGVPQNAEESEPTLLEGGIQVIDVSGTLAPRMNLMMKFSGGTSTQKLAQQIREAGDNEQVKTIVLRIDSPGGAASYTPEVADAIRAVASSKRVVASATNMMASGAYWIGSAATEVFASPSTMVGSIGVFSVIQSNKELYEKQGIKFSVLRAGKLKAAGNPYEDLAGDRKASLEKQVNDIYGNFVSAVADHRDTDIPTVEDKFGQGSTFLAAEAYQRGMIDGVLTFEQVIAQESERLVSRNSNPIRLESEMDQKIKAALFARGLVASVDADDSTCEVALKAFGAAKGIDNVTVEDLLSNSTQAKEAEASVDDERADADVILAERERVQELRARGKILGVSEADVNIAIDNGTSLSSALIGWTDKLSSENTTVTPVPGGSEQDKVAKAAAAIFTTRCASVLGDQVSEDDWADANGVGASMQNLDTIDVCRAVMKSNGVRVTGDKIEDAKLFLESTPMIDGSVNRRGDHPDMLSVLTRKSLNAGAMIAETAYDSWVETIEPLPDFKPRAFIDHGVFKRLDAITEDDAAKQIKFNSQLENWIAADRYAAKVALTVEMLVDDDLGGFSRQLRSLGLASRHTINGKALDLLNANPVMPDGNAFFSVAHGNDITSGGAPSTTQLVTHRLKHRTLSSFDSDAPMGARIATILAPAALEETLLQTVSTSYENKVPITDATINTFRGRVTPVIDAYLDPYSALKWYTAIPKVQAAPMVLAFQRGFGAEGRQSSWFEPNRQTRYVQIETRFGLALANWRSMIRNAGE